METSELKTLRFDGRDALLLLGGFLALVAAATALKSTADVQVSKGVLKGAAVAVLGLPLVRRKVFGAPPTRALKHGPLWSLLSIVSLFALLGGFIGTLVAGVTVLRALEPPDVELGLAYGEELTRSLWSRALTAGSVGAVLGISGYFGLEARQTKA